MNKKDSPKIAVGSIKSKKKLVEILNMLNLTTEGTVASGKNRLLKHQENVLKKYKKHDVEEHEMMFYHDDNVCRYTASSITFLNKKTLYIAFESERVISACTVQLNSVGVEGKLGELIEYNESWVNVFAIEHMNNHLIIAHSLGISLIDLESRVFSQILLEQYQTKHLACYKNGFLFTLKHCLYFWRESNLSVLAGHPTEDGSRDGLASYCRFYDAAGLAVEFDNVIYICDQSIGSIKILTGLKESAKYLGGLHSIADAFSVHEKHKEYTLKSLNEAISLVNSCDEMLTQNIQMIRSTNPGFPKTLNGPEGSISANTVSSIKMLVWGLKRLKENCESHGYSNVNLLSCMTLSVENLHSAVNRKQGTQTIVSYAQDFATTIKESIKSITKWSAHYFTSRERWYPLPESAVSLQDLQFPKRSKQSINTLTLDQKREMREWASINGAVVRQRSCRQETTMARAGTLPENAYFDELKPIHEQKTKLNDYEILLEGESSGEESASESEGEVLEYESDSENENEIENENENENDGTDHVNSIANVATFLVGTSSRFGRTVKFNRKYIV